MKNKKELYHRKRHDYQSKIDWEREGRRRFGEDKMQWRFICPVCAVETYAFEWRDAGGIDGVAFSCVGRWLGAGAAKIGEPGPCNYAGGGLFRLNPTFIVIDPNAHEEEDRTFRIFNFAEVVG